MTKKIIIAVVVVIAVLGIGAYFIVKSMQSKNIVPTTTKVLPTQTNTTAKQTTTPTSSPTLPSVDQPAAKTPTPTPTPTSTPTPTPPPVVNKTVTITAQNFAFNPNSITINKGDTVVWVNRDSAPHQIAGDYASSNPLSQGQSFSIKYDSTGTYNYHCAIHPSMTGVIIVK